MTTATIINSLKETIMKFAQYDILNSNASNANKACIRVKLHGVILAEVRSEHSNPLKYLRCRPLSEERQELVRQLRLNSVPESDITAILTLPQNQQK